MSQNDSIELKKRVAKLTSADEMMLVVPEEGAACDLTKPH